MRVFALMQLQAANPEQSPLPRLPSAPRADVLQQWAYTSALWCETRVSPPSLLAYFYTRAVHQHGGVHCCSYPGTI